MKIDAVLYAAVWGKIKSVESVLKTFPSGFTYKGSVSTTSDLPESAEVGDMYIVTGEDNAPYAWNGTGWQEVNSAITTQQIDSLY